MHFYEALDGFRAVLLPLSTFCPFFEPFLALLGPYKGYFGTKIAPFVDHNMAILGVILDRFGDTLG